MPIDPQIAARARYSWTQFYAPGSPSWPECPHGQCVVVNGWCVKCGHRRPR